MSRRSIRFGDEMPDGGYVPPDDGIQVMDVPGCTIRYVAKGISEIRPNISDTYHNKIPMTGAAVEFLIHVPPNHRLIRFEWKHLDAALADSVNATEAILIRDDNMPIPNLRWRLYYEAANIESTTIVPFGEGYEYYRCDYILSFNTTNGHWIAPILYLQELKP